MDHKVLFFPAWDKTNPDLSKSYGVSCLDIVFQIIGEKGVVEFELATNWYQKHVMDKRFDIIKHDIWVGKDDYLIRHFGIDPYPMDVCYYSLDRLSEDDTFFEKGLDRLFDGKPCYYGYRYQEEDEFDSKLWTTDYLYELLLEQGDESVWKFLEWYYQKVFGKE